MFRLPFDSQLAAGNFRPPGRRCSRLFILPYWCQTCQPLLRTMFSLSFDHSLAACYFQPSTCHSTSGWRPASFSHTFPPDHGGANGVCAECHTSGDNNWTCFTCHNEYEMTKKHNEEGIADYVVRCMDCNGDGRKHDD